LLIDLQNRGIGLAICQALAKRSEAYEIYATSRSAGDLNLQQHTKLSKFHYPKLDISSTSSIDQLRATIEKDHGHVDIVINNAGVNLNRDPSEDRVERTMDTNYRGTLHMCQAFIPILSKDGRIVNVSSIGSSLGQYSSEVAARFRSAHKQMTLEQLEAFAKEYEKACKENTTEKLGFCPPNKPYSFSKASMNALTAILARENPGLTINCCCPGWVDTEMGHQVGHPPKKPGKFVHVHHT